MWKRIKTEQKQTNKKHVIKITKDTNCTYQFPVLWLAMVPRFQKIFDLRAEEVEELHREQVHVDNQYSLMLR